MDYDEIYKNWDTFPDCRILIDLEHDGGERVWGKVLPGGFYGINNDPLHREYRWQDIVTTTSITNDKAMVHRRWKTKADFRVRESDDKIEALAMRERILAAFKAAKDTSLGFWAKVVCYVHFEEQLTMLGACERANSILAGICTLTPHEADDEK